jgi:hypothetical protein
VLRPIGVPFLSRNSLMVRKSFHVDMWFVALGGKCLTTSHLIE